MGVLISFLRGVNMIGHNKIKMADLSSLFREIGYHDAETYIQSGNVVFTAGNRLSPGKISYNIGRVIREKFGYEIPVLLRTGKDMEKIIKGNPYREREDFDASRLAVVFLSEFPGEEQLARFRDVSYLPDEFRIAGKEIYIYCPNGFGRTKLHTNFFENRLKITCTARNWQTVNRLFEMAVKKIRHQDQ